MKHLKIFLVTFLITATLSAQECKDKQIISSLNAFTAATLYNTYGLIGSVMDGFTSDAYKEEQAIDLLKAQSTVLQNLSANIDSLVEKNYLVSETDLSYAKTVSSILKDLKKQAELAIEYFKSRSGKKRDAFTDQRDQNWKNISKLLKL